MPSPYAPPVSRLQPLGNVLLPRRNWLDNMPSITLPATASTHSLGPTSKYTVHSAPRRPPLSDAELKREPPLPPALLDSDGVPVYQSAKVAKHSFSAICRTSVMSSDWCHLAHATPVRTWRVKVASAALQKGDVLVGCSEASSFEHFGRTLLFDGHGALQAGHHPLNMVHKFAAKNVRTLEDAEVEGAFAPTSEVEVTVDLSREDAPRLYLLFGDGSRVVYPLDNFTNARLCVSLRRSGDTVELL